MNCLNTMAPDDEDILKYVLDEAPLSQEARAHINQCSTCQQRLASYKDINTFLLANLYRQQCPESMRLSLYCAGALSGEERTRIAAHAQICPLCAQEIADTRHFLEETESIASPLPSLQDTVRRIVATLVPPQSSFVTRSSAATGIWPQQYRAEAYSLLLSLSPGKQGKHTLMGTLSHINEEIAPDIFEGQEVKLYHLSEKNSPFTSTFMDDMGSFVLHAIPIGTYSLLVCLPDCEIEVKELVIAAKE
jgi:Putative zinc-finger